MVEEVKRSREMERHKEAVWGRTDMKKSRDPVIAAALEYERATLDALETLDGTDREAQIAACVRFVQAMQTMGALPDCDRGLTYLMQRGRIPDFAWKRIHAAVEILAADLGSPVH
jgi:hypothetical protein